MSKRPYDVVIIGAGILGLATARELLGRHPGLRLLVLEKDATIAGQQTGHNSGVMHAGIYYKAGSLKATLCTTGVRELFAYCEQRGIPVDRCGKVIVATDAEELPRLDDLYARGLANGVPGLERISPERLRELEPHATGIAALWSPNTAIVDFRRVAAAYAEDVRAAGGAVVTSCAVRGIRVLPEGIRLATSRGGLTTRALISCAGLQSDRLAIAAGAPADSRIVPFRGDYYVLRPERRHLCRGLIYPVPDPALPFLGVHFTKRIDGAVWAGPNAVLAFAREGYGRLDINLKDMAELATYPGFWRMASQQWRTGVDEIWRDFVKAAFVRALQRYVPECTAADLVPGPSGVRAQAVAASGALADDFLVYAAANQVHVRNAPSPAATSSLAIARLIADRAEQECAVLQEA
ncbi:MAG TPA: L-2-hydroxyglutarate oxidase [Chloroflexia bacterium]|nr:L-2-hydroxyglutarate oxidase [Chloroflexia bacterium]